MSGRKTALDLDSNLGAMICYLGNILCGIGGLIYSILVVVQDKTNKVPRFHAFQSIFLSAAGVVLWFVYIIGFMIALAIDATLGIPIFFFLVWLVVVLIGLAILVGWIMAAVKAYQGQIFKLPLIGNLADKYSG